MFLVLLWKVTHSPTPLQTEARKTSQVLQYTTQDVLNFVLNAVDLYRLSMT